MHVNTNGLANNKLSNLRNIAEQLNLDIIGLSETHYKDEQQTADIFGYNWIGNNS